MLCEKFMRIPVVGSLCCKSLVRGKSRSKKIQFKFAWEHKMYGDIVKVFESAPTCNCKFLKNNVISRRQKRDRWHPNSLRCMSNPSDSL